MDRPPLAGVSHEKVAADFDRFVESYAAQIDDAVAFSGFKADFFVNVKCRYLLHLTRSHFGDNRSLEVLDLGCGVGNYHPHLAGAYQSITAIDVSPASIDYASRHNKDVHYDVYPGGRLPYADASFDVVFTSCVMHHVPVGQWQEFVGEMHRVLKPGGLAVVFEHNPLNPLTSRIVRTCPIDVDAVLLRPRTTRSLFEKAGFAAIRTRTILSLPPVGGLFFAADRMLGWLPFGAQYYLAASRGTHS